MTRIHTPLGIAGALLVPAAAIALTTPNIFSDGDVLTASDLNENFQAMEAEINSLRADVTALQSALNGKASTTSVSSLQTSVSSLDGELNVLDGEVSSLQSDVAGVVSDTSALVGSALHECTWHFDPCEGQPEVCVAVCPAGKHAVAIGCDSGASGLTESYPVPPVSTPFPADGSSVTAYNRGACRAADPDALQTAFALCCSIGT